MKKTLLTAFVVMFAVSVGYCGLKSVRQWNAEVPEVPKGTRVFSIDSNNKLSLTYGLGVSEDLAITLDANDEEVTIQTSQGYGTAGKGVMQIVNTLTTPSTQHYLLELWQYSEDDTDADYIVCKDSTSGTSVFKVREKGILEGQGGEVLDLSGTTDGTISFTDGTNTLATIVDGGTTGDVTATGSLLANTVESRTATTLTVGPATATKVEIADTGIETEIQGTLDCQENASFTGDVSVTGAIKPSVTEITTNGASATQTLTAAQSGYIVVAATEAVTLNLPAVSGNSGLWYEVKLDTVAAIPVYAVTLDGNASETIDGATTNNQIDNWYDYLRIFCDGDEWLISAEKEH